jgi:exodeoxyribonuclease V alpha subunit
MSEATGREAKTIHRLLEYNLQKGGFQRNEENPLACDALIVDEASMIDTVLMHHLLKAVPLTAAFILVGDVNQLPSVGAGNVLGDVIESGAVPVVRLTQIFRQASRSQIIVNAHKINEGIVPFTDAAEADEPGQDFFHRAGGPEHVLDTIIAPLKRIRKIRPDPLNEIQVLTPMHKLVGTTSNRKLQEALNPGEGGVARASFLPGRRQGHADPQQLRQGGFNGDIGRITALSAEARDSPSSSTAARWRTISPTLDEIVHAYAVSVHKAQGSEYPAGLPVLLQHYILLQRNLIYTAVTRARRLGGPGRHPARACHRRQERLARERRYTRLCDGCVRFLRPS